MPCFFYPHVHVRSLAFCSSAHHSGVRDTPASKQIINPYVGRRGDALLVERRKELKDKDIWYSIKVKYSSLVALVIFFSEVNKERIV
jgi:hypothetical protein